MNEYLTGRKRPEPYHVALITTSDTCSKGKRFDESGGFLVGALMDNGFYVKSKAILPDEVDRIAQEMIKICDGHLADLIVTTGGTGLSPRDVTPEATAQVIDREVPGLAEAMRYKSMEKTPMAMLSRGICGIRKQTLIVNLPGSLKGVQETIEVIMPVLSHGLALLTERNSEVGH